MWAPIFCADDESNSTAPMQDEASASTGAFAAKEPSAAAVSVARAAATIGDAGELILANGTRLGSRKFQKYFRQNLVTVSSTEATLINSLRNRSTMFSQFFFF